jgi:hypothetical protein
LAFAQSDRGTITGSISDSTNAVIPGASIVATNGETGAKYETISTETGNYTLTQVPPGVYQLSVELPGFKKYVRQGITVLVAQTLRLDVSLEVGAATDEVTVNADAPLLRTESSDVSHVVNSSRLDDLPILGIGGVLSGSAGIRNPYAMVQLVPGSTWTPNSLVRMNGTPANTQSFRIEGQDASNTGTPGVPAQSQPGVDAIQEVAIQTSNFAAEYGQVGGGVFNVTMKSGTNQYHGTVYDNFVNEVFNAGNPFKTGSPNTRPRARRNDYGFTVGGPVRKDKTFFFFNFEQFRETQYVDNQYQTVPTLAYRNGDFSTAIPHDANGNIIAKVIGTDPAGNQMLEGMIYDPRTTRAAADGKLYRDPFPGNIIPKDRFDPVALKIQALLPLPNGPAANSLVGNYIQVYPTSRVTQVPSFKIDQILGKGKLSFFYQKTKTTNPNGNTIFGRSDGLPDPISEVLGTFQNAPLYRLNYDYTLSPTKLLHLGAGYRSNYFLVPSVTRTGEIVNYNAEKELGLKGGIENKFFPTMSGFLNTANGTGGMKGIGSEAGTNQITQSPSFNAYMSWVKNNHSYKFGSEFRTEGYPPRVDGNTDGVYGFSAAETGQPFQSSAVQSANVGFGYASFLLGQVDSITMSNPTRPRMGKKQLGIYAQDTWKVTSRFTLDYGLRYDYSTYLREQYGRAPEFSPTTIHPKLGIPGAAIYDGDGPGRCNCDIAKNYPYAFGPRLGAAYQITRRTVFRAGFGIVYSGTASNNNASGGLAGSTASTNTPFGIPVTTLSAGIPLSFRPAPWPTYDPGYFPTIPLGSPTIKPGAGPAWMDPNAGRPARQYQWSIGFQREINQNLVVDLTYVGNRGIWWQAPGLLNLNANTPERLKSVYGLDVTVKSDRDLLNSAMSTTAVKNAGFKVPFPGFDESFTLAQALRPFPQFTTIPVYWNPMGRTWYDALQIKVTQRLARGLSANGGFSWSKALTIGTEIGEPNPGTTGNAVVNNVFDRNQNKYISRYDQPFMLNMALNYTTPKVGFNKWVSLAVQNWTLGAFLQYASGFPLQVPNAQTSLNNILFQGASFANRVPGQPLFTVNLNCHCYDPNKTLVLNPAAWTDPAPGTFGSSAAYYSDYRSQRRPMENLNFGRTFRIGGESSKKTINLRMEFTNIFNRAYWSDPSGASLTNATLKPSTNQFGNYTTGFGFMTTTGVTAFGTTANLLPRQGVLVGRFTF